MSHWLVFIAVFMIVIGVISIGIGIAEWWRWRKESKQWLAFRNKCRITIKEEGES